MNRKSISQAVFNTRADKYDNLSWVYDPNFGREIVKLCNPLKTDLILDLGSGSGSVAFFLNSFANHIIALDFSMGMLKKSIRLLPNFGGIYHVMANGEDICFNSGQFNIVVARNSIHHFDNPIRGLEEVWRILKPDGVFILIEPIAPDFEALNIWKKMFQIRDKGRHNSFYYTESKLCDYITSNNFKIQKSFSVKYPLAMKNWLDVDSITEQDRKTIMEIVIATPQKKKELLGIYLDNDEWIMDHTWALVRAQRGEKSWKQKI